MNQRQDKVNQNNYKYWDSNAVQCSIQARVGQVDAEFDVIDTGHINQQEMSKVKLCTLEFCESLVNFGRKLKIVPQSVTFPDFAENTDAFQLHLKIL